MNPSALNNNPLSQLRDIHLPDPVSWWPLAWPWWLALAVFVLCIGLVTYVYLKNKWRKQVVKQMQTFESLNDQAFAQACNRLLKQIALNKLGSDSSRFHGMQWLYYLDQQVRHPVFLPHLEGFARWIDEPNPNIDRRALEQACKTWIRKVQC